jgi:transposase
MNEIITVGLDLGDKSSEFCVLDAAGQVLRRGRVQTTAAALRRVFGKMAAARMAIEVCVHSPWVSRVLSELGHEVVVAHAARVPLIYQSVKKRDRVDAEALARLCRLDPELLCPVKHRSQQAQEHLQLIRSRDALVSARTQLINHARSAVKVHGERLPSCSAESFVNKVEAFIPPALAPALLSVLSTIAHLNREIRQLEKSIGALADEHYPQTAVLRSVPGVGPITALAYVLTLEEPQRFARSRDVGPYLGLTPKQRQSGASEPHLRISKAGNGHLRRLLVACAHYVLGPFGPDTALRRWGLSKASHGGKNGKKRAVVAVARKLAVLLHRLWTTAELYRAFPNPVHA